MIYLLDANVLITAKNQYYEFGRVDEYWDWLAYQAEEGNAKLCLDVWEEVTHGTDELSGWAKTHKANLILDEDADVDLVQRVINEGYAPDLTDIEIETIGRDPFLIASALVDPDNRVVVTGEVRKNTRRHNRRVPNVCDDLGVKSCNQWEFGRALDFKTNWKRP